MGNVRASNFVERMGRSTTANLNTAVDNEIGGRWPPIVMSIKR